MQRYGQSYTLVGKRSLRRRALFAARRQSNPQRAAMSKGTIALSIVTAAVSAILVVLVLRGFEERARVDLPHFRKYPHWIFARLYKDPTRCEATARRVGFKCHYAPRWQIWLWRATQEYYRATGTKPPPSSKARPGDPSPTATAAPRKPTPTRPRYSTLDEARRSEQHCQVMSIFRR